MLRCPSAGIRAACRFGVVLSFALTSLLVLGFREASFAQTGTNPLSIFKNYFVTGDYVVAGWVEGAPDGSGFAPGTISIPDTKQPSQNGVPTTVPKGADIVAAYLYWATVEGSQSTFAGQQAFFNSYAVSGTVLGNPKAPVSWSSGGCSGSAQGSKTMRTYRADVRPYLPIDLNPSSPTFGALQANGTIPVRLADSGSNGNTQPNALGATLVIIYRVLSPNVPLNAIVLYDGAYAPSNAGQSTTQKMVGFYQPAVANLTSKLTHIVGNGQVNKNEQVFLNNASQPLLSLYGTLPPFPGVYGSWDNPTWVLSQLGYVSTTDTAETTSIVPSPSNGGCVSWGAMILSTTVQDTDSDGLLDVWETNQGYTDAVSGQWVALPGASPNVKDIFAEVDYLNNLDGSAGPFLHSHLPKQAAVDAVGGAFATQGVNVHFDLGTNGLGQNIYPGDPYVIQYPVPIPSPLPPGTSAPQAGTGGKAISEGAVVCTDGTTLCAFPGQPAIGWKGDFEFLQNQSTLGNFQPGRDKSYRYLFFGHSVGAARSYWSTFGTALSDPTIPRLVSIVNSGTTATVTIQSPVGVLKPGDCPNPNISACADSSSTRITVAGALGQAALNGTYFFASPSSSTSNGITTTTFSIATANVASGTYDFSKEPQLGVTYLGPTSTSGHSDFGGGGDAMITLGLWGADDPPNCQPDPSQSLGSGQTYCNNQTGSIPVQSGTLMHELGHALTLTHGGTYYKDPQNPFLPSYELNCKPNFVSVMNYLFQVRGFVDGGYDYSGQTLPPLSEAYPSLSESIGLGVDLFTSQPAAHLTRWYSVPNKLDVQLQNTSGHRYAAAHCDGSPLGPNDVPGVRVDGSVASGGTFSAPLDFNNDLTFPDAVLSPGIDLNYNGTTADSPFSGFNDWESINLQQMSARANAFGSSAGGGLKAGGGGLKAGGGGIDNDGGGLKAGGGGLKAGGGGLKAGGGGTEVDLDTVASTADPPTGLTCTDCVGSVESNQNVPLSWNAPSGFGQIRSYGIWRAQGTFPTPSDVTANANLFTQIGTVSGAPPVTTFTDTSAAFTTYTYFVTETNKHGGTKRSVLSSGRKFGAKLHQYRSDRIIGLFRLWPAGNAHCNCDWGHRNSHWDGELQH
ncbi:MAG TPA: hypothetical protein VFI95_13585 [Terriglobales bacterium]|nr:hypothetical protein [Terriglobales bacterium]